MQGGFRFFRFRGVDVYVHWTWFLVAAFIIQNRTKEYSSPAWNVAEYMAVFFFVLLHEFGHVFACRQTGGQANRIMLWPLGGIAYVNPPQRAGAQLWSIAAGPLVNVALIFVLKAVAIVFRHEGWNIAHPEAFNFLKNLWLINAGLLLFNLLPVYPLDGGQIVRSVLWFWLGKARSLWIACLLGFAGGLALGGVAITHGELWFGFIASYLLWITWSSFQHARALLRIEKLPRHDQFRCPRCQARALRGNLWKCPRCQTEFDLFASGGRCPQCAFAAEEVPCVECGQASQPAAWSR